MATWSPALNSDGPTPSGVGWLSSSRWLPSYAGRRPVAFMRAQLQCELRLWL
jgi:hypothetical protein